MYISGMGVRKAFDKALHYFTLSAHQGHSLALYNLGQVGEALVRRRSVPKPSLHPLASSLVSHPDLRVHNYYLK